MRAKTLTGILFLALVGLVLVAERSPEQVRLLTNQDIIEMSHLGLDPEVLLVALQHHEAALDGSPQGISQLRWHGVPAPVIEAIHEMTSRDRLEEL